MSTYPHEAASTTDEPLVNSLRVFNHPDADLVLRSHDSHHFRVPKIYVISSSPVLEELIRRALESSDPPDASHALLVVQLPERGAILLSLLTFIFPMTPLVPSTPEEIMELLSVAQKYQMGSTLDYIRGTIARQNLLPTRLESALHIYALAQKYGLLPEALEAARAMCLQQTMTIEDFDNTLDIIPGTSLYELWKYHERVRAILSSDLTKFRISCTRGKITGLRCTGFDSFQIASWLGDYIKAIEKNPNLFDTAELNIAMVRHIKANRPLCECASMTSHTIHNFWGALASVVHESFDKAKSALSLVREQEEPQAQNHSTTSPPETFDVPDANFIIRSSDNVDFRVHKSVLAMASPFFRDLLSLPQPSDSEAVDGLPVVQLSEDSELLNSLVPILYPVRMVMPNSYEKVLCLLAACQKYGMDSVQSIIRAEVSRGACPVPEGAEAFAAYAIASAKGLIPEMENAARLTLDRPMTFESIGEGLKLFEGRALRDLVNFRKRCRDNRRRDYHDQSQEALALTGAGFAARASIDHPDLLAQRILRPPPLVASPKQRPPNHAHSFSLHPPPPRIPSEYPVTYWADVQIGTIGQGLGLKNFGNTCYMNSTIQCLSATVPFARFFTDGRWKSAVNMVNPLGTKGHLVHAFSGILHELRHGEMPYISPFQFRRSVCLHAARFGGSEQQDSQEFLSFLLDGLHEDLNRMLNKPKNEVTPSREEVLERLPQQIASEEEWKIYLIRNDSIVVDFFQGQFRSRLECLTCHKTSTTYNSFMYLSLPIPSIKNSKINIQHCLDAFVKTEVMEKADSWNCPRCKTLRKAHKTLSLSRLPPVLIIHLKRFSSEDPFTDKIENHVDFPLEGLDLTNYMPPPLPPGIDRKGTQTYPPDDPRLQIPPYRYDLYAVTNHSCSLSSGHYTAFIASRGGWLFCDDSRLTPANANEVVGKQAYVLYYKRVKP